MSLLLASPNLHSAFLLGQQGEWGNLLYPDAGLYVPLPLDPP